MPEIKIKRTKVCPECHTEQGSTRQLCIRTGCGHTFQKGRSSYVKKKDRPVVAQAEQESLISPITESLPAEDIREVIKQVPIIEHLITEFDKHTQRAVEIKNALTVLADYCDIEIPIRCYNTPGLNL